MDISNTPNPTPEVQRQPVSLMTRIVCCIVLFACSVTLPMLTYHINRVGMQADADLTTLNVISICALLLCVTFVLLYCRKPVFLSCALACFVILFLFSAHFCITFAALLCATVAGTALLADAKGTAYLPFAVTAPAAYLASFALTRDPLLALNALLPAIGALAFAICFKKKFSVIISVGTLTGTLAAALLLFSVIDLTAAGVPLNAQGLNETVKAYHQALSSVFSETFNLMLETEETSAQIAQILGGEITPELITEFSDSIATAIMGLLPGILIMMLWIFSFVAHRGFTAILLKGQPKEACPLHMSNYAPSVPTAVLMLLCYLLLLVSTFFERGEVVAFIALNLLCILMPILSVSGILGIIANVKMAKSKWPFVLLYGAAVVFLGFAVIPMIAFFGAFGVIMQAIAKVLEQKLNNSQGGPMT